MQTSPHATAPEAFAGIPTPSTLDEVSSAQIAALKLWEARGSYGCEHHVYVDTMRRVSAILFAPAAVA